MTRSLTVVSLLVSILAGCGESRLLTDDELARLDGSGTRESQVIYYAKTFRQLSPEKCRITTHAVVRVGENAQAAPEFLAVIDGSVERLTAFEARVIQPDGSKETFGKGDLSSIALANRLQISDHLLKFIPVVNGLEEGALVEQVSTHDFPLARMGLPFSLSSIGGRARHIVCSYQVSPDDSLLYHIMNDTLSPVITRTPEYKEYRFTWNDYAPASGQSVFSQYNSSPGVLATLRALSGAVSPASPWVAFGDWYLSLIEDRLEPDDAVVAQARRLAGGKSTDLEKLEAIVAFCQSRIRYEQVYLAWGEMIPNAVPNTFARGYGDCKDYSALIYSMARAAGVQTQLALCHRGRRFETHPEVPVAQFNHVIVHFADGGKDYWFDGTNRCGPPGVTTSDLINASALVLQHGASRMLTIAPHEKNMLRVHGALQTDGSGLRGELDISLEGQYAVDFLSGALYLNPARLKEELIDFLKEHLNPALTVTDLRWEQEPDRFLIAVSCRLPGVLTTVAPHTFVSIARLFPALLPSENPRTSKAGLLFLPGYEKIDVAVDLPEYREAAAASDAPGGCRCAASLSLLPGPAEGAAREAFIASYERARAVCHTAIKLVRRSIP